MIPFVVFVVVVALLSVGSYLIWFPRPSRHARCLANIDRLERELFPEHFPPVFDGWSKSYPRKEWLEDIAHPADAMQRAFWEDSPHA